MNKQLAFGIVLMAVLLAGCGSQEAQPLLTPTPHPDSLVVDAAFDLGEISPYVYGVNHGPWAFVTVDVYPQALSGGFTYVRFPGGNWGDLNTMTPREVENMALLAEQMGAELSISVRLTGGTPEVAADLVRLVNQELGLDVRYWSIGNEPGLYDDYDTVRYNREWRAIAEAMLAVDPDILLVGPDVTQFTGNPDHDPRDANGLYWIDEFLKSNGDLVDVVSIHRYPFPASLAGEAATRQQLYDSVFEWDTILPALREKIVEITGREIPVAVTEVNSHWTNVSGQEASPDSFANAVWWADVLSRLIAQDVEIVTYFSLQSNPSTGAFGVFARYDTRPTYYVYQLFQQFGTTRIYAASPDTQVTISAAQCADGDITAIFVNRAFTEKQLPLVVNGAEDAGYLQAVLLAEGIWAEEVPADQVYSGQAVDLPAESVVLLTFSQDQAFCMGDVQSGE